MKVPADRTFLLAAGGTGGHLFPAQALAEVLTARGHRVELVTDRRGGRYDSGFSAERFHVVPADTLRGGGPLAYLRTVLVLAWGTLRAWLLIGRVRPAAVIGFGGYPTVPPIVAARLRGVPTAIHEQNAVMGRANRMLAGRVDLVATSFPQIGRADGGGRATVVHTGAPVRAAVMAAAAPYEAPDAAGRLRLLVFGGSQGARIFSDVVPEAIGLLGEDLRRRLAIVQQCREEDLERVRDAYAAIGVDAELGAFFADLPARMAHAHLVVARSGAGTVAELAAIGRPAILVPLPHAIDNDQLLNASAMAEAGGGWLVPQSSLSPRGLAEELTARLGDPEALSGAAAAARGLGNPRAADALADAVTALAEGRRADMETRESAR